MPKSAELPTQGFQEQTPAANSTPNSMEIYNEDTEKSDTTGSLKSNPEPQEQPITTGETKPKGEGEHVEDTEKAEALAPKEVIMKALTEAFTEREQKITEQLAEGKSIEQITRGESQKVTITEKELEIAMLLSKEPAEQRRFVAFAGAVEAVAVETGGLLPVPTELSEAMSKHLPKGYNQLPLEQRQIAAAQAAEEAITEEQGSIAGALKALVSRGKRGGKVEEAFVRTMAEVNKRNPSLIEEVKKQKSIPDAAAAYMVEIGLIEQTAMKAKEAGGYNKIEPYAKLTNSASFFMIEEAMTEVGIAGAYAAARSGPEAAKAILARTETIANVAFAVSQLLQEQEGNMTEERYKTLDRKYGENAYVRRDAVESTLEKALNAKSENERRSWFQPDQTLFANIRSRMQEQLVTHFEEKLRTQPPANLAEKYREKMAEGGYQEAAEELVERGFVPFEPNSDQEKAAALVASVLTALGYGDENTEKYLAALGVEHNLNQYQDRDGVKQLLSSTLIISSALQVQRDLETLSRLNKSREDALNRVAKKNIKERIMDQASVLAEHLERSTIAHAEREQQEK